MNFIRSMLAITFLGLSGLAAAQAHTPTPVHPALTTPHERAAVRRDNREIARDRQAIMHTHHELRQAQRAHDFRRVRATRHTLHHERLELHHDRMERRHDRRELHR